MKHVKTLFFHNSSVVILFLSYFISLCSYFYLSSFGLTLAMEDGRAHLNIARRVVDSLTPGLAQLGGIWLPLPHIFMLPTIWNDYMWQSGLSGIIPSMIFFVLSAVFLFKLLEEVTKSKIAAYIATIIYITSPNLLFIQASPMTESISISLFVMSVYAFWKWSSSAKYAYLVLFAIFTCLLTLVRYDGWIMPMAGFLAVFLLGLSKKWKMSKSEGNAILFIIPAILGIVLWVVYNFAIFKNPLNFLNGQGSARWFAETERAAGRLPTEGNILVSAQIFGYAVINNIGLYIILLALLSLVIFVFQIIQKKFGKNVVRVALVFFLLAVPVVFNIYSLFSGNSIMWVEEVFPNSIYNVRYALQALPLVVFLIACLVAYSKKLFVPLVLVVFMLQVYTFMNSGPIILLRDITQTKGSSREVLAGWLKSNPPSGLTLMSASANEVVIFDSGMDIKDVITEGNDKIWKESLKNPFPQVSRIITGSSLGEKTDNVAKGINKKELDKYYRVVYKKDYFVVYDRVEEIGNGHYWEVRVIDTMKTSRDEAKNGIESVNYKEELSLIKGTGANYVTVDTPYDEEFYPYLKEWVDEARRLGLKVWFRGNFSGWEGWNDYPKTLTREQHLLKTRNFIRNHPGIFSDGDAFTPCPECEYGGPGSPLATGDVSGFREFMLEQYRMMNEEFERIGKQVYTNWTSMNPDVARVVYTQDILDEMGNMVTLDYFVRDAKALDDGLNYFSENFPGVKIFVGEFGAPIPDINGSMTEDEQAKFISDILKYIKSRNDVVGVNYWVSVGGTTGILRNDLMPKKSYEVVKKNFTTTEISGVVKNTLGKSVEGVVVYTKDKNYNVITDSKGEFRLTIIGENPEIEYYSTMYEVVDVKKTRNSQGKYKEEVIVKPRHQSIYYFFNSMFK